MDRRTNFEKDGFVAVSAFYGADELKKIEQILVGFISNRLSSLPPEHVFFEDKNDPVSLKQIQRLHEHEPFFGQLMDDRPRALADELLDEPVVGKNLQYFNKPPALGQATPSHQDGYYFMLEPFQALTMWMALDRVDEENGCMRYVRGSHARGLRSHGRTQTLGFSQGITDFGQATDMRDEVVCPAQPGDLLAHHALTIHRADANQSTTRNRRALGFIYYGESARENTSAHEAYQQDLARELADTGKI